jgi:hypothetical protein
MEAGVIPSRLIDLPAASARSHAFAEGFLHAGGECRQRIQEHDEEPGQPASPNNSYRARDNRFGGTFRSSAGSTPRASERRPTTLRLA